MEATTSAKIGIGAAYEYQVSGTAGGSLGPIANAEVSTTAGLDFSVSAERGGGTTKSTLITLEGAGPREKNCYCVYARKRNVVVALASEVLGTGFSYDFDDLDIVLVRVVGHNERCPACPEYDDIPTGGN